MKKYYAIQDFQEFKVGQEVPEAKGEVWIKMYLHPPVKCVEVPDEFPKELDLNGDKKLDKKDSAIASKVMNKFKKNIKKSKR